ncbi:oxygenase MpaB family protein [Mycolicibacterium mucogenicum]|nr:oxygenase MpaB family protein [Mycolicibacterium mucogenicum]
MTRHLVNIVDKASSQHHDGGVSSETVMPECHRGVVAAGLGGSRRDAGVDPRLGPDSLTWSRFGDYRTALLIGWAGTLQVMHPVISAALVEHSDFLDNPTNRLVRSAIPITRAVYEGPVTGRAIRDEHVNIRGHYTSDGDVSADGVRYHALNPEPFFWAHATFFMMQIAPAGVFTAPLTAEEKEQLYQESRTWYAQYGMSLRGTPETFEDFMRYWDNTIETVLTRTELIDRAAPFYAGHPGPPPYPQVPGWLWNIIGPPSTRLGLWVCRALLPERARESLGWTWTASDQRRFDVFACAVRGVFTVIPRPLRLSWIARRGYRQTNRKTLA